MSDHGERHVDVLTNLASAYGQSDVGLAIAWALGRIAELEAEVERERHVRGTAERESWQHAERTAQLYIEREERDAKIAEQAATIERLRDLLRSVYKLPRPWIDGGVSWQEWDAVCARIDRELARSALAAQDSQEVAG